MNRIRDFLNRSLYAQVAVLLLGFWIVHTVCMSVFFRGFLGNIQNWTGTDETSFIGETPFHSWSILLRSLLNPIFFGALLLLYVPHFVERKVKIVYSKAERILLFFFAFIITWELTTYDYNYYLDSAFYFDRLLLLGLCIALFRFPVLTPLFFAFALVYRAQFNYPVAGFPLYDIRLVYDLLIVFSVHHYLRRLLPEFSLKLIYLAVCVVVAEYFWCGIHKILISPHGYEWLTENDPADLFNNVYLRGWLACSSETVVGGLREIIMRYGEIFQWFVFVLELGVIAIFWNRKLAIGWLTGLILMHTGIFIFGSMLFWKWMAIDAAFIVIFIYRREWFTELFVEPKKKMLAIVIVVSAFLWMKPVVIGWHDTPFTQYYTYEVIDVNGNVYEVDKNQMNPYHQWFQYDQFPFLAAPLSLDVSGFGYTSDYELAEKLREPGGDYQELLQEYGIAKRDTTGEQEYVKFIQEYFRNRNARKNEPIFLTALNPPYHLHTEVCGVPYVGNIEVREFRVTRHETVAVGGHSFPFFHTVLLGIEIAE